MKIRSVLALVGLAISFAFPTFAQQQKSLKELIVGTWILESVYDQTADGVKHNPWGDGVKGQAISIAFPTDDEYHFTVMKPIPDPTMGPFLPHVIFKRAPVP